MKKTLAVLILSGVCAALLFAQDLGGRPQPSEAPQVVPKTQVELVVPVVPVAPVVKPAPVEVMVEPVETVVEEVAEIDEIGITNDMTAGAELVGGRISLTLKGVELREVIGLFSRLSNANIIVPDLGEEIEAKRIDMNLDNVEWKPALQAILDTNGLELYEKIPSTEVYSIRPRAIGQAEPTEIRVFKLKYATVSEITNLVSVLVRGGTGSISTYPARNSIVAQGSAKLLSDLDRVIQMVDLPREQVFIEAKFLELNDRASEQLGIDWQVLSGYNVGLSGLNGNYTYTESRADNVNRFTDVSGRPYESLDVVPEKAAWLLDPNSGVSKLYNGIDYPTRDSYAGVDASRIFGVVPTTEAVDSAVVGKALTATLNADDFNVVLAALKETTGAKIVSNPKIIVANEETANIYIGTKEPNIKQETTQVENTAPITTYNLDPDTPYFEYGIRLDVTPTVNTSSNITVQINPSLKRFVRYKLDGNNSQYPVTTEKTIQTIFSLQSGQTAAIGGLTELTSNDEDRKIPFLGDLPLVGRFFSYMSKVEEQTETIIFVTLGLANPENINMDTGLPEDSALAMRYQATARADRMIRAEELKVLEAMEAERLQDRLDTIRSAEQKRLDKQKQPEKQPAINPVPAVSSIAPEAPEEDFSAPIVAAVVIERSPAPIVQEAPAVEEIIRELSAAEPVASLSSNAQGAAVEEFGGGTYEVKSSGTK